MQKALFISHCVPYPPNKGERLRAFHIIDVLGKFFDLSLLCFSRGPVHDDLSTLEKHLSRIKIIHAEKMTGMIRGSVRLLQHKSLTEGYYDLQEAHRTIEKWGKDYIFRGN